MKSNLKILVVEDSLIFAQGIQLLLEQHPLVEKTLHSIDYKSTLDILKQEIIDIIILDLNFETKEYDGFTIADKVKQLYPKIKIMILTQNTRIAHYEKLFNELDVDAYLDKQLGVTETFAAIDEVVNNRKYIDYNISQMLEIESWMRVSKRENDILDKLSKGNIQKEIADQLYISPRTVEVHVRNLFKKFKVKNVAELMSKYIKYKNANRENIEDSTAPFKS
ncbi:response regulator transcription factor [uncultured Kordia sp.]|uniref:response regulator transcription factor n=1 Tax=uncultured Kordia sp. TaxID=507699 RepID=UPI0026158BEA|nr:response regulator transcription factor [uncultured Kordia sp.]